jgi:hypothetical protein
VSALFVNLWLNGRIERARVPVPDSCNAAQVRRRKGYGRFGGERETSGRERVSKEWKCLENERERLEREKKEKLETSGKGPTALLVPYGSRSYPGK